MSDIKEQKEQFVKEFIDAVSSQSIEKCKKLILPFEEYVILVDDKEMTADKYDEALTKQCMNFFAKEKDFFDDYATRLKEEAIDSANIYKLEDSIEITDNFYYSPIGTLSITMQNRVMEDDVISSLGFQIDNPMMINSKIRINNFLFTKVYNSFDYSVQIRKLHKKFGFKEVALEKILEILEESSFDISTIFDDYYQLTEHAWWVYDGDLSMTSEEFNTLHEDSNFLITGNLIVDGVCELDSRILFILKNLKAKSIFIDSSICYVQDTAYFDDVLVIEGAMDDEPVNINNTEGKFVFNRASTIDLGISKDRVNTFIDYINERGFGDAQNLLKDRFLEIDEDEIDIETDDLRDALLNNETIFKQ